MSQQLPNSLLVIDARLSERDVQRLNEWAADMTRQIESARRIAVYLEQECARHTETIDNVRAFANGLLDTWAAQGYGADLLGILNGEHEDEA